MPMSNVLFIDVYEAEQKDEDEAIRPVYTVSASEVTLIALSPPPPQMQPSTKGSSRETKNGERPLDDMLKTWIRQNIGALPFLASVRTSVYLLCNPILSH